LNLKEFMQLEGYAYRLLPVKVSGATDGYVNTDIMYDNLMENMYWREMDNENTYYDNSYLGSPVYTARIAFLRLVGQLLNEGKHDLAKNALEFNLKTMPDKSIPYDQISANFIEPLFTVGNDEMALDIADKMATRADENLTYAAQHGRSNK